MKIYRGYILIRLKSIGTEFKVVEKINSIKSNFPEEDWDISFVTTVYGGWDLVVECSFNKKKELDKIVSIIHVEEDLSKWVGEITTLVSTKPDYPP